MSGMGNGYQSLAYGREGRGICTRRHIAWKLVFFFGRLAFGSSSMDGVFNDRFDDIKNHICPRMQ